MDDQEINGGATTIVRSNSFAENVESFFNTLTEGLRGVLLVMTKKTAATLAGTTTQILIDCFQLLSLAMLPQTLEVVDHDGYLELIADFFRIFQFGQRIIQLFGFKVALGIVTSIVLCELLNIAYVAHSWIKKTFDHLWAIKLLRYTASLLIGVLYIPMVSVMGLMISCSTNTHYIEEDVCVSLRPFICIVLILFIVVSLLLSSAFIGSSPASGSPASKPHSRVDTIHLCVKTAASLLFASLSERFRTEPILLTAWHGFIALSGISLAALNLWYLPWFHPVIARLRAVCMCIFCWVGICMLLGVLAQESSNTFILALSTIGVVPLCSFAVDRRRKILSEKTLMTCSDSFEFELMVRQKLLDNKIIFNLSRHRVVPEHSKDNSVVETTKVLEEIDALYNSAMKHFPLSTRICAFYAEFACAFNLPSSNLQIRKAILEGESRSPGFAVSFTLFKLRNTLKQKIAKDGDVMSYVASEKYEREATNADKRCCTLLLEFWRELGARRPDMGKVRNLAAQAAELSHRANTAYSQLVKVKPKSIEVLTLYSGFLSSVANDRKKAVQLTQRIQSLNAQKNLRQGTDRGDSEMSDLFPVVSIDVIGEDRAFGEIITANAAAGEFLNESNDRLLRKDFRSYLLPHFSAELPELINDFFDTGSAPFQDAPKHTFILTSHGDCVEVELRLIPYTTDGMEYCFFATWAETIYPSSRSLTPRAFMLVEESNIVLACSHECREVLEQMTSHPNPVTVEDIFIDFEKVMETARKKKQFQNIPIEFSYPSLGCEETVPGVHIFISTEGVDGLLKITFQPNPKDGPKSPGSVAVFGDDALDDLDDLVSANEQGMSKSTIVSPNQVHNSGRMSFLNVSRRASLAADPASSNKINEAAVQRSVVEIGSNKKFVRMGDTSVMQKGRGRGSDLYDDEEHSHASMSSAASLSATAIRTALQSQSNDNRLSPILARLQKSYVLMLVMAFVCASVVMAVQNVLLSKFVDNVDKTTTACLRRTTSVTMAFSVHSLMMKKEGMTLPGMFNESIARSELLDAALRLKTLEEQLFQQRTDYSESLRTLYENPSTPLISSLNGDITKNYFTMYDATSRLTAKAVQAYSSDLSEFGIDSDLTFYLMNNVIGDDTYLNMMYSSSAKFSSETLGLHGKILKVTLATMSLAMLIELIVLFAVMNPIVGGIEQNKSRVLEVFAGIPIRTVKDIAYRYQERLTNIHGIVVDNIDDEEAHAKVMGQEEDSSKKASVIVPAEPEEKPTTAFRKPNQQTRRREKSTKKRRNNTGAIASRYGWFLLQLGSAILLSVVYFAISLQYGQQIVMDRFGNVPQQINNFASIRTQSRYALHMLRLFITQTDFEYPGYDLHIAKEDIEAVLQTIEQQEGFVVNGNSDKGFEGLLNTGNPPVDLLTLMFSNGCHRWVDTNSLSECQNFGAGILRTGLNSAISDYTDLIRKVMKKFPDNYTNEDESEDGEDPNISCSINASPEVSKEFFSEEFLTLANLEGRFLRPQLTQTQTILAEEVSKGETNSASVRLISFVSYLGLLFLLYVFVVQSVIKSLDSEVKHTRSLLLMIPEDALEGLKSVQKFLMEEFKNANL